MPTEAAPRGACRVVTRGTQVELRSPHFVFALETADSLRGAAWENRLTRRRLELSGPEVEVDVGLPAKAKTLQLALQGAPAVRQTGAGAEAVFHLRAAQPPLDVVVTYRWVAKEPLLHKQVEVRNAGDAPVDRLLHVRLGTYRVDAATSGGEQGFPLYLEDDRFVSVAHPSGWSTAQDGTVSLRQYPGQKLLAGATFTSMDAVYGVAKAGEARRTFVAHVRSRMRRVARKHDKPYAIFEPFGARPGGNFDETEEFVLDSIAKVAEGQRDSGCHFDLYSVDFWVDYRGDLKRCDPERFPNGLTRICQELKKIGTAPGLWIDSSMASWSIGGNPDVQPTWTHDPAGPAPGVPYLCRATEPARSLYLEAFRHHIRENGVRLLKFDNLSSTCSNPGHEHLPGIYSTEAIQSAVIEFLHALDAECPDVFLMLYWGHHSPWWLLHADTLFDSGIGIEAASPSDFPAPYARDSVTQKLDQAQRHAMDVPALGKDSLGVWLSDWGWNSSIGKERWQGGFIMDICRGSLLAQPWSDTPWLSPPERKEMADLVALLKARPKCFANPRFILGDAREYGPYGYCCTDGQRAFVALSNPTWEDRLLPLSLNAQWGLPGGRRWDLYRWYPEPARLRGKGEHFGESVSLMLRPFEVALLEVVPAFRVRREPGGAASLPRRLPEVALPTRFAEASQAIPVEAETLQEKPAAEAPTIWAPLKVVSARSEGGAALTVQPDGSVLASAPAPSYDTYTIASTAEQAGITGIRLEMLPDPSLPGGGPGRAVNGNFMLNELRVAAAPQANPEKAVPVALRNPAASYSQESHGGWPIAAVLDGDLKTGWSIDPQEGLPHEAVFETAEPIGFTGGTLFTFTIGQGEREHSLGRFRFSVTTAPPPLPAPRRTGPRTLVVKGQAPATRGGGLLVVTGEMAQAGAPLRLNDTGKYFETAGELAGRDADWQPVLGKATYPSCWQGWRLPIEASESPRPFELRVATHLSPAVAITWKAHFLPR